MKKQSSAYHGLGGLMKKASRQLIPLSALIEVTYKCNLGCKYCYITREKRKELSGEKIKKILDELAAEGCLYLTLSGGEIFTRKDAPEIIKYAADRHFAVTVFTNGTLISEDIADKLAALSLQEVGITVWGAISRTHGRITGKIDSFVESLNAIKMLVKRGVKTVWKCTLTKENFDEYPRIIRLAERLGCGFSFDPIVTGPYKQPKENLKYRLSHEQLKKVFSDKEIYPKPHIHGSASSKPEKKKGNTYVCDAGKSFVAVSAYGDVFPCVQLPVSMGNLMKQSFTEIWKSKEFMNMRKKIVSLSSACLSCRFLKECTRCPGLALAEDGDISGPSKVACDIAKIK